MRLLSWIKQALSRTSNILILTGVLVISLSLDGVWWQYNLDHSVLDSVDTSPQGLDPGSDFSYAAPFSPTLTPFQPQHDQEASGTGSLSDASSILTGRVPDRLVIPAIQLDAPIVPIHYKSIEYENQTLEQWLVPNMYAAGWQDTSALLGLPGNTVLNGHHNAYGQVFKDLINLDLGDRIEVYSGEHVFTFRVVTKMLFQERYRPVEERLANARWILPTDDERLTLNTCWPPDSNTDRLVVVAFPINR